MVSLRNLLVEDTRMQIRFGKSMAENRFSQNQRVSTLSKSKYPAIVRNARSTTRNRL